MIFLDKGIDGKCGNKGEERSLFGKEWCETKDGSRWKKNAFLMNLEGEHEE